MNEVEKMYRNAGIKPYIYCSKPRPDCDARGTGNCKQDCEYYSGERLLAPFTAEKQLELIKWLINKGQLRITRFLDEYSFEFRDYDLHTSLYYVNEMLPSIEEGISFIINNIWQDLTPEEKQQVKGILE